MVGWCLLLLSLMQYAFSHTLSEFCFMFFFANGCHDGAGLTAVSQSVQGCQSHVVTWIQTGALETCL